MVGINMDGPARDRVMKLIQEKDRIESEIRDQTAILGTNNVGMHDSLVDGDGYPRNDIDVYKVRHARHQIICLQNDHKSLMKQIERGLAEVHSDLLGSNGEGTSVNATTPTNVHANGRTNGHMNGHINGHSSGDSIEQPVHSRPFGVIRFVNEGSPADLGGLITDDEVLEFGTVNSDNFRDIYQIQDIVAHSVGQRVNVKVKRGDAVVSVTIVPRQWSQRGLLGCQIDAL